MTLSLTISSWFRWRLHRLTSPRGLRMVEKSCSSSSKPGVRLKRRTSMILDCVWLSAKMPQVALKRSLSQFPKLKVPQQNLRQFQSLKRAQAIRYQAAVSPMSLRHSFSNKWKNWSKSMQLFNKRSWSKISHFPIFKNSTKRRPGHKTRKMPLEAPHRYPVVAAPKETAEVTDSKCSI